MSDALARFFIYIAMPVASWFIFLFLLGYAFAATCISSCDQFGCLVVCS